MNQLKIYEQLKVRVHLVRDSQTMPKIVIDSADDVYRLLKSEVDLWDREKLLSIMLNNRNQVIAFEEVAVGSLTEMVVHPREVFKSAILANATAIILVHNHPCSENPEPSKADKQITQQIKAGAKILNIALVDHLIITKNGYISLNESTVGLPDPEFVECPF